MPRGTVEVDPTVASALRERFETLDASVSARAQRASSELRLREIWELGDLAMKLVGAATVGARELCPTPASLARVAALGGAAALASDTTLSDAFSGSVVVVSREGAEGLAIGREPRPIDSGDFLRAVWLARAFGQSSALLALRSSLGSVTDESLRSHAAARDRVRALLAGTLSASRWSLPPDSDEALRPAPDFLQERTRDLVVPFAEALHAADAPDAAVRCLARHHAYYSAPERRADLRGYVAWGPLALIVSFANRGLFESSEYLPPWLVELTLGDLPSNEVTMETPDLHAATMLEARLRLSLSFDAEPTFIRESSAGERSVYSFRLDAPTTVRGRVTVTHPADEASLGEGTLLDAGELVHLAEEKIAGGRGGGGAPHDRRVASAAATRALAILGAEPELYRDQMTSPLGRALCDERPRRFSRDGLLELRAEVEALTEGETR
jgi:hypothetical protein